MKYVALLCLLLSLSACDGDKQDDNTLNCETLELNYEVFGAGFMTSYCNSCHSATLTGLDRQLAPTGIDFDTHDQVLERLGRIRVRTVDLLSMPPLRSTDRPGDGEIVDLDNWIECGAP